MAKGTWEGSGTWKTSGFDASGLAQVGVIAGVAVAVAVIIMQFAWLIVTVGVIAVAVRLWLLHRQNVTTAGWHAAAVREHEVRSTEQAKRLAEQRQHELDVARAGAPVIRNVIDPAALIAALSAAHRAEAYPERRSDAAWVYRAEVEPPTKGK
jgi:hypothetical protein